MGYAEREPVGEVYHLPSAGEFDLTDFNADEALKTIDRVITEVYLPLRGQVGYRTERAILVADRHVPHRENDAEHMHHIGLTVEALWADRGRISLGFPAGFDIGRAVRIANAHDTVEVFSEIGDVDAMTPEANLLNIKPAQEEAAHEVMRSRYPYLSGIVELSEECKAKRTPEARMVHDLDKIVSTRLIYHHDGERWHDWEGQKTKRAYMCDVQKAKLTTSLGRMLFEAMERDFDEHPEYFPDAQGALFNTDPYVR